MPLVIAAVVVIVALTLLFVGFRTDRKVFLAAKHSLLSFFSYITSFEFFTRLNKSIAFLGIIGFSLVMQSAFGQSIFSNPITGTNPNTTNPYTAGQTVSAGITVSGIGRGTGITGVNQNNEYRASGWNSTFNADDYFEWTINPNSCRSLNLVSFEYNSNRSNININSFSFRSSLDNYASGIGTPTAGGTTIDLSGAAFQNITGPITFRLYAWGTSNAGHTFSIEDFTFNGTITTNPTANAGPALAAICQGGTSAVLGGSVGGGATGGTWSSSAGGTFTPNATTLNATWTPPAGYTGTATLTLTTSGGSCGITTASKTIAVNPPATVGAVSANQTICSGSSPSDLTIASATGTIQWQRADNAAFTLGVTSVGTNSTTLTSAQIGALTATRYFRVVVTSGGCASATSAIITVNVDPASAVGAVSGNQTICSGVSPANMTIGSSTGTVQWQRADDAAFLFNVTNIGTNSNTLTSAQVGALTETRYFRAVVTNGTCPPVTSGVITVNVNPSVTGITPDQTVCSGTAPANMSVFTATGNIQWEVATNAAFTTGVANIAGATGLTLTSAQVGPITATRYYRARVSNPGNTCIIYSSVITVSIEPVRTATSASPNQTVCVNSPLTPITFTTTGADNIGTPVNLPPGLTAVFSGTSVSGTITISGTPTTAGTYNYTIPLTGGCGAVNATGTITVSPSSVITGMARTVCSGTAFSAIPVNGTDGSVLAGTTYSWPAPVVTGGLTGGAAGTGTLATGITGTLVNPTNVPRTATYTVTPRVGTCNGVPFEVVVTVNPTPVIPAQSETICSGSAFNISPVNGAPSAATIVPAGTTYTWTVSSNPNVTGQSNQTSAQASISQTLVNNTNVNQTLTYTVTPTSGASGTCAGPTFTVTVVVTPRPVIPAQSTSICSGTTFTVTPTNGIPSASTIVPAGTTYTWTVADNPDVTGEANQAGPQATISQTLTNTSNTVQNVVYTVTPTSGGAGNCIGSTFTVTVAVLPRPTITPMTATVCSGESFSISPANGTNGNVPVGTTYTWSTPVVTGSMTGGVAGSGGNITGTLSNPTNTAQTATYTVTPTSGACAGSTFTVTVTVNPRPAVTGMTET
ncbi:MAG: hypothetical protein C0433_11015, partial [Cyclobacterium sp.]|nr:hypothetical protein [Cyclobacterium sp.]